MHWLPIALLMMLGCRGFGVEAEPEEEVPVQITLAPYLVGSWSGSYVGVLGILGSSAPPPADTFHVSLAVWSVAPDFAFRGDVRRGTANVPRLYECDARQVEIEELNVHFPCRQGDQFGDTLVFSIRTDLDTTALTLTGHAERGLGFDGRTFPLILHRTGAVVTQNP